MVTTSFGLPADVVPAFSVPTDVLLSHDDRFLHVSNWAANSVRQYDITDPFSPVLTAEVTIPRAQMMRLSPDNRRLYVTNSLLSTWDDAEFPAGVIRNSNYGVWKIDIDHDNGGMVIDPGFFVGLDSVQEQNTIGPACPHQVFLDPDVRRSFGEHWSAFKEPPRRLSSLARRAAAVPNLEVHQVFLRSDALHRTPPDPKSARADSGDAQMGSGARLPGRGYPGCRPRLRAPPRAQPGRRDHRPPRLSASANARRRR